MLNSEEEYCERCGEILESFPGYHHSCRQNRKENALRKHSDIKKQNEQYINRPNGRTKE